MICFIFIFTAFNSKHLNAQSFMIKGGVSLANMLDKEEIATYSDDYSVNPGFHVGAVIDLPISTFLSLESGFTCSTRGYTLNLDFDHFKRSIKMDLMYLDIPINLKVNFKIKDKFKIFSTLGVYGGAGLIGNYVVKGDVFNEPFFRREFSWGNDMSDNVRRFDWGLTSGSGIEFKSLLFGISYEFGLANISSYQEFGTVKSNRVLKFSVGCKI